MNKNWPHALRVDERLAETTRPFLNATCAEMQLSPEESERLVEPVLGLASYILRLVPVPGLVGIAGSQGSGKSTITELVALALERGRGLKVARLSIDDFYLPKAERMTLGRTVHPLLKTRGVAGTHDMVLMGQVIDSLLGGQDVQTPRFNKAVDDREPEPEAILGPVDYVLVEGWCVGALPEASSSLVAPLNTLEAEEDPDGEWRRFANGRLSDADYRGVFDRLRPFIFLEVPGMESVFSWRLRQEKLLEATRGTQPGIMDEAGIRRFIMHYERTTRNMLATLPAAADVVLHVNEQHQIESATLNN